MSVEDADSIAPSEARQVLLRALDSLDQIEREYGEAKRTYLVVVFAHQVEDETVRGWESTNEPTFITTALLREVADYIESPRERDDD